MKISRHDVLKVERDVVLQENRLKFYRQMLYALTAHYNYIIPFNWLKSISGKIEKDWLLFLSSDFKQWM